MPIITDYPGIYISEEAVSGFSINSSATAVPVFAHNRDSIKQDIQVFYNWAEFLAEYPLLKADPKSNPDHVHASIKLWFMNGGGKCYLARVSKLENAVKQYDDITLLVSSGIKPGDASGTAFFEAFDSLISNGYRIFGLFDGPEDKIDSTKQPVEATKVMKNYPDSPYGAVFYPWGKSDSDEDIPPSAIALAAIVQTDRTRGVWKAPANQVINGVTPRYPVSDDLQGPFNKGKALNMIRSFPETGTVVWGARTLKDNDNWRYIPVRRLFSMVERDIQKTLNALVFEPNTQPTWERIKAAVDSYLHDLWQQGALAGNTPKEAWLVQIGKGITMTTEQINQGKMIIKVGLAPVRPAEFIILQFTQTIAQ